MILIVDDDRAIKMSLSLILKRTGYAVETADGPDEALGKVRDSSLRLIIMDMNFSRQTDGREGIELLQKCKVLRPEVPVILITAWGSIPLAVKGMQAGAFDFVTKPWNNLLMLQRIETALKLTGSQTDTSDNFDRSAIIGRSKSLMDVLDTVRRVALTDAPVLILGENGTGKELIAQTIHNNSHRHGGPFVMVNLGGISQSLFESEMFGHTKGAFTGAVTARKGRFEMADKGSIFLDEIGDLDLSCQVKMLRVLQQHTFEALGDSRPRKVDMRVICATNANLTEMVRDKSFREDLFYRINLITLHIPPLRDRREDIPLLVNHFAKLCCGKSKIEMPEISSEAMTYLTRLPYPGNIRELKNIVERAILVNGNKRLEKDDFNTYGQSDPGLAHDKSLSGLTLDELEKQAILSALEKYGNNLSLAATSLGITRQSLYRRIAKYDIRI